VPRLARQLAAQRQQRDEVAGKVERLVRAHPLQPVLTSMPGVGVRTAARLLIEVAHNTFASTAHLAAYAGLAPVRQRSGSSIRAEPPVQARKQGAKTGALSFLRRQIELLH
jgi:transposase